jgi:hypothetical protein
MRLLDRGQQIAQRAEFGVILKAQIQPPIQFLTQAHGRPENPPLLRARPTQRASDDRVNVYLKASEFLLDDGAEF